jgi:hypothetical protein
MNKFERDPKPRCVKVNNFFKKLGRWVGESVRKIVFLIRIF